LSPEYAELVGLFEGLDTPGVSDALDKLGIAGQCLDITPLDNCQGTAIGTAFTVKYVPCGQPAGTAGDFIDDVAPGDIVVIDNDGRTDCTVWGDITTQYAGLRGIAGTVIDGVCRDVAWSARQIEETESRIRDQINGGKTLGEAPAALGYHRLQRTAT
jgi:regulator of RNase E activity RraA